MMNIKALLTRGVRNLIDVTKISSSRSFYCSLSSTSCSSASRTSSGVVSDASTAAAGVDDVAEEEEDQDLVYSDTVASSILKPAIPTLLQPRVVVYDGVCHLCHRGCILIFFQILLFVLLLGFLFHPFHINLFLFL